MHVGGVLVFDGEVTREEVVRRLRERIHLMAGVPLREVYPAVPLNPRNQALTVGILTYDGGVHFGLLADRDALADLGDAAGALERALAVLTDSAR
jgi:hypothetical protein